MKCPQSALTLLFIFTFYNCVAPVGFLPWGIRVAFPWKASYDRFTLPNLRCMLVVRCCHNPPSSNMDNKIFNVRTDVHACDCTRGCADTVRESALKVDPERKSLAAPGNRTCVSSVPARRCTNSATFPSPCAF